jgi:uncharacterized Zn-binding protein involved in type VI secretion
MGDKTSHGGTVIGGDPTFDIYGKSVARVGDLTVCPKCKGIFPIKAGLNNAFALGQALAVDGDKTACGATLIASQATATAEDGSGSGTNSAASNSGNSKESAAAQSAIAAQAPTVCLECLAQAAATGSTMVVRD